MALLFTYIILILIFWEDIRDRSVHWFLFPLLFLAIWWFRDFIIDWKGALVNLAFLVFIFGGLTLYLTLKHGKLIAITKAHFGWGDILFLLALAPFFDFANYVLIVTFGTLIVLVIHLISSFFAGKDKSIPFAGYFAIIAGVEVTFSCSDTLNLLLQ